MRKAVLSFTMLFGLAYAGGIVAATPNNAAPAAAAKSSTNPALSSTLEKNSYSIGIDLGNNFKQQEIDIDAKRFMQGLEDGLKGESTLMTQEQIVETLKNLQQELLSKRAERFQQMSEENRKKGEAFLAENKGKTGVVTLPSGLQYKIITEGKGTSPAETDIVTTQYKGMLLDGTEFDSSYKRGQAATFPLNGVIPGWTEALKLMKSGSKWELYVPANLAYGEQGAGGQIGPNETLIFEVELLSFQSREEAEKARNVDSIENPKGAKEQSQESKAEKSSFFKKKGNKKAG